MILGKFANKSFVTRLCSGIVLVALILYTVITGGNVLFGFNFIISMLAVYELYKVLGIEKSIPGLTGYVAMIAYYVLIFTDKTQYTFMLIIVFLICLLAEIQKEFQIWLHLYIPGYILVKLTPGITVFLKSFFHGTI